MAAYTERPSRGTASINLTRMETAMTLHVHHIGRSTIQTTEPDRAKAIAAAYRQPQITQTDVTDLWRNLVSETATAAIAWAADGALTTVCVTDGSTVWLDRDQVAAMIGIAGFAKIEARIGGSAQ